MSTEPKRTITPDDQLRAYAMLILAQQQYVECRKLERGACRILGLEHGFGGNTLSDLLYANDDEITMLAFEKALANEDITVAPDPLEDAALATIASLDRADDAKADPILTDAAAVIRQLLEELERLKVRP